MRHLIPICFAMLMALASGCSEWSPPWDFWWGDDDDGLIESPAVRIERFRLWGESAENVSPAEQADVAGKLSQAYHLELNGDPLIRREAVRALALYRNQIATDTLHKAKSDPDASVRAAACEAWGRRGGDQSVAELESVVRNERDQDVKHAAIRGLGEIQRNSANPYGVVGALVVALDDKDPATRQITLAALEDVTGRYYADDVDAWRRFAQGQDVPQAERSLAQRLGLEDSR